MSESYHRIVEKSALEEGRATGAIVNGWPVAVAQVEGEIHAFLDKCTHLSAPLAGGRIIRGNIQCPQHGARFSMATGACVRGTFRPIPVFASRLVDGWIEVAVPDDRPPPEYEPARIIRQA